MASVWCLLAARIPAEAITASNLTVRPGPITLETSAGVDKFVVSPVGLITLANGETIDNGTNNTVKITATNLLLYKDSSSQVNIGLGAAGQTTINAGGASQGVTVSDDLTASGALNVTGATTFTGAIAANNTISFAGNTVATVTTGTLISTGSTWVNHATAGQCAVKFLWSIS